MRFSSPVALADLTDRAARQLGVISGAVTETELWRTELRAGRCFMIGRSLAVLAGNNDSIFLRNPTASGVTIILRSFVVWLGTAGQITVGELNANLGASFAGRNCLSGGAVGLGVLQPV